MPRDGSNVYHKPFPDVVPDTTIESTVYNGFVADVEQDLNTPRPIIAGGTGANSASESLVNLGAETSSQVVTNFDSQVWFPGSFRAASSATASPVAGHAFAGWVYSSDVPAFPPSNQNVIVEARDLNDTAVPGAIYTREKKAGVWGAWVSSFAEVNADIAAVIDAVNDEIAEVNADIAALDAAKVAKAGDTMSGQLNISYAYPIINLSSVGAGTQPVLVGSQDGLARWSFILGDNSAETGGNVGSNFALHRHNDAGTDLGGSISINRATNAVTCPGGVSADSFTARQIIQTTDPDAILAANGAAIHFRPNGFSNAAGEAYVHSNGSLVVADKVQCSPNGVIYNGYNTGSGGVLVVNALTTNPGNQIALTAFHDPGIWFGWIMYVGGINYQFRHDGNAISPTGGPWIAASDARIKNVVGNYASGLDQIAALNPVRYTYKGNDTLSDQPDQTVSTHHQMAVDSKEFIGLIAQDIETVLPETVSQTTAYIDGTKVTDLRLLDTGPILFALINACKELKARVEALEAAP